MDNKHDQLRIEGHELPEIQEHYANSDVKATHHAAKKTAAGAATRAPRQRHDHAGGILWSGVAALAVIAMVIAVYFLSGTADRNSNKELGEPMAYTATEIYAVADTAGATVTSPAEATDAADASGIDAVYLFPTNGSEIGENDMLNAVAEKARKSGADVTVTAYTDETGPADYNRELSERRAASVGKYLARHGVDPGHITTRGMGPTHAYATNALDRRAEIRVQ